jgi:hypothetical protein
LIWLKAPDVATCHHRRVTTRAAAMSQESSVRDRPSIRTLLLPREHGSWSLALEPLALGLIAAPSWPGAALALGALALFFARRPWQGTRTGNRRAWSVLVMLGIVAALALALGVQRAAGPAGLALLAALPAGAAFAWFDQRKAGREAAAELSGATFFAVFPAALALAAGRDWPIAAVLAGFALARSVTTILAIRTFLRRRKGESVARAPAVLAAIAAVVAFGIYANHTGRWVPALWTGVFLVRTNSLLGPRTPQWTARQLGTMEAVLGVVAVVSTGLALR